MRTLGWMFGTVLAVLAWAVVAGCGDDDDPDGADAGGDAANGAADAGGDAGRIDSGQVGARGAMCPTGGGDGCNLVTNGCGEGQGCYFLTRREASAPICAMAGAGGYDAECSTYLDCQAGFFCDTAVARCRAYCCGGQDVDCPTGQICAIEFLDADGVGQCAVPDDCDPVAQTGCSAGLGCYPLRGDGAMKCITPLEASLEEGEACEAVNDCRPGLSCFTVDASQVCMKFCDTGDAGTCAVGQSCQSLGYSGEGARIGVCQPPASR